ncbi:restriction endonuclease subunit S [Vibrio cyclitrophicus]
MIVGKKSPEIRFKGFSGEWKSFSLDEISEVLDGDRGHNYPNGEDLKEQGHTLFLSASNVTKNGFKFDVRQYITQEKSESLGNGKLIVDDIILTSRGSIGHIAWYNEGITKEIPFARINSGMLILRVKHSLAPSVISQYLKSPKGKKKIEVISFGSAQPQLTKASVSKFSVSIPNDRPEQAAIGNYFQKLDSLVNQHQQKHDKLSNLKTVMLEKMFPKKGKTVPEIRFKGFSGEWVSASLSKVANKYDNLRIPVTAKDRISGNTPYYGANGIQSYIEGYTHDGEYVLLAEDGANDLKNYPIHYVNGKVWVNNHAHVLKAKEMYSNLFLKYALVSIDFEPFLVGGGRAKLNASVMMDLEITFTENIEEQTQIGNYFQKLDTLIEQYQQQITKLNNIKQACLSKMFV